jgi:signal transduction histidine kinase
VRTSPVGVRGSDLESSLTPRNDAATRAPGSGEPEAFARISRPLLRAAAERVAARWKDESGESLNADEVRAVLTALAVAVEQRHARSDQPADPSTGSVLGRRLLELLRAELIAAWTAASPTPPAGDMLEYLRAVEQVREEIEPDWAQYFSARLSGPDGLDLVVEVAHDLRSPLTSILFLAETLHRGQTGEINEVQRRQLGLIYGAALGLSSASSDVIELARGGDRLVDKEPSPFSVTETLEAVRDIVRPIAEEKSLSVRLLPPASDHRLGHPLALSRVLLNLTTNALKFTDEGFVEITVRPTSLSRVEFAVRDTGHGINPDAMNALYQPFRRTRGRSGYYFSGTGLGLAICRKLVTAMGSELKVESRPDWGTRFFFELELPVTL